MYSSAVTGQPQKKNETITLIDFVIDNDSDSDLGLT
jgi:hypothetical protein